MTPEAAREKWCPFARIVKMQGDHPTDAEAYGQTRCIADECMAWRWDQSPESVALWKARDRPAVNPEWWDMLEPSGHCGLAGEP